jgi:hypothetical protein
MSGLYCAYLRPRIGSVGEAKRKSIEKTLRTALAWYRCDSNTWIICTVKDARIWYARLGKHVKPGGHVFISRLDVSDRAGWMPKAFWEWMALMKLKYPDLIT